MSTYVTALAVLFLAPSLAQAQVTLQYHWTQGETLIYRTTLKTDSTASGMPGAGEVSFSQTMTERIKLLAAAVAPDGSVTLHQTIDAVRVEMSTPMGKVTYDSSEAKSADRDEGSQALGRVFGGMIGATISVTMAPSGAIQRIDGVQKAYDRIVADLPADRSAAQMAASLKSVMSEASIRAALEQSFPRLPAQPLKPGETWTNQVALGNDVAGKITGTQTFTFKQIDGADGTGFAAISVALAVKQESSPPIGPSGMTVKLGDGKGEGEVEFDVTHGRIRKATMRTDLPTTMTSVSPDGRQVTMKNATKTSMTLELIEK